MIDFILTVVVILGVALAASFFAGMVVYVFMDTMERKIGRYGD